MAEAKKKAVVAKVKSPVKVKKTVTADKVAEKKIEVKPQEVVPPKEEKKIEVKSGVSVDLKELLEAGAHFGHQARRWNPKMKPYIYTTRDNVHIFDLMLTAQKMVEAADFITQTVASGKEVLFVGTKRQAAQIIKEEAVKVGAPFVSERWLGGLLTNWEEMTKRIKLLNDLKSKREKGELSLYTKRERVMIDKDIARLERFFGGIAHLSKRPDALFVIDVHKEIAVVKEAKTLGVPVVAMVDTNSDPNYALIPIPINDDAIRSIKLTVAKMGEAYAKGRELANKNK